MVPTYQQQKRILFTESKNVELPQNIPTTS